jgi:hypothetical protein
MTETTTWYEISGYSDLEVKPIQVVKRTERTLTIREDMWGSGKTHDTRRLMNGKQFDSLEAANAAVLARYELKLKYAEEEVALWRQRLENWKETHS